MYNPEKFLQKDDIVLSPRTIKLIDEANSVYKENFDSNIWYGRCIFFSWYCKKATCTFCYRSTLKHQQKHAKNSHRSIGSMLTEALFCKIFNWRIEFLTGGYQEDNIFTDIVQYAKLVSTVYGEKIWVNIGWLTEKQLELLKPYVKGVCASIETPTPSLHTKICPDKPINPYEEMFDNSADFAKSAAFIVGLGDTDEDFSYWVDFITRHKLQRITVYALKPVRGGAFTQGPSTDTYISWLARLRIAFPKLEIIGGTNLRRTAEIGLMVRAGVNAITKFPATKQFASNRALSIRKQIESEDRTWISNIEKIPEIDWEAEIESLTIDEKFKEEIRQTLPAYLLQLQKNVDVDCE